MSRLESLPDVSCKRFTELYKCIEYQNAIVYLGLRKTGCPKKLARNFSKKTVCKSDSTRITDGPPKYRTLNVKPIKNMERTSNGWKFSRPDYDFKGKMYMSAQDIISKNQYQEEIFNDFYKHEKKIKEDYKKQMTTMNAYIEGINKECQVTNLSKKALINKMRSQMLKFKKPLSIKIPIDDYGIDIFNGSKTTKSVSKTIISPAKIRITSVDDQREENFVLENKKIPFSRDRYGTRYTTNPNELALINLSSNPSMIGESGKKKTDHDSDLDDSRESSVDYATADNNGVEPSNSMVTLNKLEKQNQVITKIAEESEKLKGLKKKKGPLQKKNDEKDVVPSLQLNDIAKNKFPTANENPNTKREIANEFNRMIYIFSGIKAKQKQKEEEREKLLKETQEDYEVRVQRYLHDMHDDPKPVNEYTTDNLNKLVTSRKKIYDIFEKRSLQRTIPLSLSTQKNDLKELFARIPRYRKSAIPNHISSLSPKSDYSNFPIKNPLQFAHSYTKLNVTKTTNLTTEISRLGTSSTTKRFQISSNAIDAHVYIY